MSVVPQEPPKTPAGKAASKAAAVEEDDSEEEDSEEEDDEEEEVATLSLLALILGIPDGLAISFLAEPVLILLLHQV